MGGVFETAVALCRILILLFKRLLETTYQMMPQRKNMLQVRVYMLCMILVNAYHVWWVLCVALKMAVGGYGGHVAVSLLNRLHGAKDWVVRALSALLFCDTNHYIDIFVFYWLQTAVKTSVVIHRLVNETEPTRFMDELCAHDGGVVGEGKKKRRIHPLDMDGFLDTKATEGKYDFSEWVRAHCKYIDESLDAYYHTGWYPGLEKSDKESRLRSMSTQELLDTLPRVQRIQRRMIDCSPTGGACQNDNTLFGLSLVVRESFKIYKAISEGIINLADKFFEMKYHDGIKAMEIYNEALQGGEDLQKYHAGLQQMDAVKRVIQFPKMEVPPSDFLDTMKKHLKDLREASGEGASGSSNQPLRKGKEAKGSENVLGSFGRANSSIIIGSLSREVSEEPVQEKAEEEAGAAKPPTNDLLGFDDAIAVPPETSQDIHPICENTEVAETALPETTAIQQKEEPKSDLDLLSDLDFSALHLSDSTKQPASSTVTQHSSTNPIPDAFVMGAAAHMYGNSFQVNRKESTASVSVSSQKPSNNPFA